MEKESYRILDRVVIRISGDIASLIQGLSTNTIEAPCNAFVDQKGKLIALVDQLNKSPEEHYLIVPQNFFSNLWEHLNVYLPYSKAAIEKLEWVTAYVISHNKYGVIQISKPFGSIACSEKDSSFSALKLLSSEAFETFRIENNLSEQGIDFEFPMLLEINRQDVVSFSKGCYLGQEVIARVQYKGRPKRKLVRILYESVPEKVTVEGEVVGEITSKCFSEKYNRFLVFAMIEKYDQKIDFGDVLKD